MTHSGTSGSRRRVWLWAALVLGLALLVRVPKLATIPPPTDETDELLLAWSIYTEGARPLTASDAYLGPLLTYAIAVAYALLGPSFAVARTVPVLSSAFAVVGAYFLGLQLGGIRAAVAAASMTLFAFGLVVMGHVAWSHGGAPALVTLALAALVASSRSEDGRGWALAAGAFAGLAVAAHPTVLAIAPGAAVWWLLDAGQLRIRLRKAVWICLGVLIAYAPGILLILREGTGPFQAGLESREYASLSLSGWPNGLVLWLTSLARNAAGPPALDVTDWRMWFSGALLATGLAVAVRMKSWLPLAVVGSAALLTPLFVTGDKFTSLTGLRFAAPVFPVAAAAVGCWVVRAMDSEGKRRRLVPLTVGVLVVVQAASLASFYRYASANMVTGEPVLAIAEGLRDSISERELLFIDGDIDTKLIGGGDVGRAIAAMLTLSETPYTEANLDKIRWYLVNGNGATYDLVISETTRTALGAELKLEPIRVVDVIPGQVSRTGASWGWYRYTTERLP